ncbi:general substrate transporter [Hyphopichia burtonii NRRL Y-1933]|uniref:General substrate transporter n=1 Tax=Hyphopichia burtonii NRRL Y-1933 TaxID=984485 RepID=A0A1E4RI45_9ASCO|nr:general substrate transporter [Hyphopichia burtonii NRRL Y-1933]ODV66934.1 general substrate transporter [Hyphopichia burtonii NRRL Y-1933]
MSDISNESKVLLVEEDQSLLHKSTVKDYVCETRPWYTVPHLLHLNFVLFLVCLSSTNNGYDGSVLNGLQSLNYWQDYFGHPSGARLGALSNAVVFGVMICFPVGPYLADHIGRRFCIGFGQALTVIGSVIQGVTGMGIHCAEGFCTDRDRHFVWFFFARIIVGFGAGAAVIGSSSLISELSYPTHREVATFAFNVFWYSGAVLASWVVFGTRNLDSDYAWRIPSFIQGALPLIQVLTIFLVPESPRFLIAQGRIEQAESVLKKYHIGNSVEADKLAFIQFELAEIQTAIENEKLTTNSSYMDFIRKKNFHKRLFLVCFVPVIMQLAGNGLVSYYLNKVLNSIGITGETEQLIINACLMTYNFVCSAVICSLLSLFKRRTLFITCLSGMLISYIIWTILSAINQQRHFEDKSLANGVLAMIFLFYLAYNIGVNGLPYLYMTEILPYSHRAKGINIFQFVQEVLLVYNGFVNPVAMAAIEWKYYIVYCCLLCVELVVVILFFPETSGRSLEEVGEVFGDEVTKVHLNSYDSKAKHSIEHVEST